MEPTCPKIRLVTLGLGVFRHRGHGGGLVVVGADVHALDAQPFLPRKELYLGEVLLFLFRSFSDGPVKDLFRHKLWQADEGDPLEIFLTGIVHPMNALLPPQAFQRRHHIVKVALQPVFAQLAHFNGESHGVEHPQSLLVSTILIIGIAMAPYSQKIHGRHGDDARRFGRQIEFLILFLVVKSHCHFLPVFCGLLFNASQVMRVSSVISFRFSTSSTRKESLAPS